jgi:hypothetical protein
MEAYHRNVTARLELEVGADNHIHYINKVWGPASAMTDHRLIFE